MKEAVPQDSMSSGLACSKLEELLCGPQIKNPRLLVAKFPISGKTVGMSVALTPYHEASVAAYWSTEAVGIALCGSRAATLAAGQLFLLVEEEFLERLSDRLNRKELPTAFSQGGNHFIDIALIRHFNSQSARRRVYFRLHAIGHELDQRRGASASS